MTLSPFIDSMMNINNDMLLSQQQDTNGIAFAVSEDIFQDHNADERRAKMEALAKKLEMSLESLMRMITETNLMDKIRQKACTAAGFKKFEDFIASTDKIIKFYGIDNTHYQHFAECVLKGINFLGKSGNSGERYCMKQKLQNMVEFFIGQTEPTMEDKLKQLKAINDEMNIGKAFLHEKECAVTEYIKQFQIQVNLAYSELASIKQTIGERNNFLICLKQNLEGPNHLYETKCGELKQRIANFDAGFYSTVKKDAEKLEAYKKMISYLKMQLNNAILNFNQKIMMLEKQMDAMKNACFPTNVTVNRNVNAQSFPARNVYSQKGPQKSPNMNRFFDNKNPFQLFQP